MFYKKDENTGEWYFGNEVHFPDGIKITSENKLTKDGWVWYDEPPQEYLDWLETQQNHINP
jgi:hypothetical protein